MTVQNQHKVECVVVEKCRLIRPPVVLYFCGSLKDHISDFAHSLITHQITLPLHHS